jgi:hypothetical protein
MNSTNLPTANVFDLDIDLEEMKRFLNVVVLGSSRMFLNRSFRTSGAE